MIFDAEQEADRLKTLQFKKRKRRYQVSRLDRYEMELLALRRLGVSLSLLQVFLREHNIVVGRSTIHHWLEKRGAI